MDLGTGVSSSKPALFLLHQEIAEWRPVCLHTQVHKVPCSLYDREGNMPEPQEKGQDRLWEGRAGHSVEP